MTEPMKVEFYVIGEDGEAFAWEPDYNTALAHCEGGYAEAIRIDKVTSYYDERETVWERDK